MYWKIEIAFRGLPILSLLRPMSTWQRPLEWKWPNFGQINLYSPLAGRSAAAAHFYDCDNVDLRIGNCTQGTWELSKRALCKKLYWSISAVLVNHVNCKNCDDWCHYRVESKVLQCFERVLGCHAMASIQTHSLAAMPAERIMLMMNLQRAQWLQFN